MDRTYTYSGRNNRRSSSLRLCFDGFEGGRWEREKKLVSRAVDGASGRKRWTGETSSSFLLEWTEERAARIEGKRREGEREREMGGGGTTPRRVEASSAHLPVRKDGGLGMRSYRGIPGFELVPPTKSIAPVRPPREELFLFSHSSYNRPNPPSHPPTSSSYADGIGQSSSASRGFVKELRIHAHQLWNRACCHQGWSALRITHVFFPSRDISPLHATTPRHPRIKIEINRANKSVLSMNGLIRFKVIGPTSYQRCDRFR